MQQLRAHFWPLQQPQYPFVSLRKTVVLYAPRDDRLQLIHVSCPLPLNMASGLATPYLYQFHLPSRQFHPLILHDP
ncbi:hypothetical protein D3C79_871970 [compost metagenome]